VCVVAVVVTHDVSDRLWCGWLGSVYREQPSSKGAILEATVEYIHSLRRDQQKMNELMSRVEQLESQERKLLLQREVGLHLSPSSVTTTTSTTPV